MAQTLIALVLVALSAGYLLARVYRRMRAPSGCGGCGGCGKPSAAPQPTRLIPLEVRPRTSPSPMTPTRRRVSVPGSGMAAEKPDPDSR
jgi:hypothetical protein